MPDYELAGSAPCFLEAVDRAKKCASRDVNVCILGESGTGKELFARLVHSSSPRASKPFVPVHCAEVASTMLESELFGYERGAFTGAVRQHKGRFEQAEGGTVFVDEIQDISPEVQAKFLRVLEQKEFRRLGGEKSVKTDFRLVSATHKELKAEVEASAFREDLYWRVCVAQVRVPPLRDRREDIGVLAVHFSRMMLDDSGIDEAAWEPLASHDWPGNVRELRNFVESLLTFHAPEVVTRDLVSRLVSVHAQQAPRTPAVKPGSSQSSAVGGFAPYLARLGIASESYAEAVAAVANHLSSLAPEERARFLQPGTSVPADSALAPITANAIAVFCLRHVDEAGGMAIDADPVDVAVRVFGLSRLKTQAAGSLSPILVALKRALRR